MNRFVFVKHAFRTSLVAFVFLQTTQGMALDQDGENDSDTAEVISRKAKQLMEADEKHSHGPTQQLVWEM